METRAGTGNIETVQRDITKETVDAKVSTAGNMPAKYIIHTMGPVYHNGARLEPEKLASYYRRSLEVAPDNGVKTISFPAISCGICGYPLPRS